MSDWLKHAAMVLAWLVLATGWLAGESLAQKGADPKPAAEDSPTPEESEAVRDAIQGVQDLLDQIWIPRARYTNSPHIREAFRPVVSEVRQAVVEVRARGRRVAFGGIVGPDGWVVTKASLIRGPVTCRLKRGRELDARLVGVDEATDLAILKIEATGLPTLDLGGPALPSDRFVTLQTEPEDEATEAETAADDGEPQDAAVLSSDPTLQPGDWVATAGLGRDPVAIGVVSVLPREIKKRPGLLGITMDMAARQAGGSSVLVEKVTPGGAAKEVGMQDGDRIVSIDGQRTRTADELRAAIMAQNPGDRVEVLVQRGGKRLRFLAILQDRETALLASRGSAAQRAHYQNKLGGKLSVRRFGFPSALQHDTPLEADECGGPLVDLEGRVVAFNISRAGRTESYALPVEVVRDRLFDLMSGRLAPPTAD